MKWLHYSPVQIPWKLIIFQMTTDKGAKTKKRDTTTQKWILTSNPRRTAMWKDSNWSGITDKIPWRQSTVFGTSRVRNACPFTSSSPSLQISMGRPYKWKKITKRFNSSNKFTEWLPKSNISSLKKLLSKSINILRIEFLELGKFTFEQSQR